MSSSVAANTEAVDIVEQMAQIYRFLQNNPRFTTTPVIQHVITLHSTVAQIINRGSSAAPPKSNNSVRFSHLYLSAFTDCIFVA